MSPRSTRRQALRLMALGVTGLAGCSISVNEDSETTQTETSRDVTATGTMTQTPAPTDTDEPTATETETEESTATETETEARPEWSGPEWNSYQFDAGNTGYNPAATGPTSPIELITTEFTVDGDGGPAMAPVIVDGVLVARYDEIVAVEYSSGERLWTEETPASNFDNPTKPIAGAGRLVYVNDQYNGGVSAYDVHTGEEQWSYGVGRQPVHPFQIHDGRLCIATQSGTVAMVDRTDGSELWTYDVGTAIQTAPAVDDRGIVIVTGSGDPNQILTLSLDDGSPQWFFDDSVVEGASYPVLDGESLYCHSDNGVFRLDRATQSIQWRESFEADVSNPTGYLALADGTLYLAHYNGRVYALDTAGGTVRWRQRISRTPIRAPPIAIDDAVYAGSDYLYCLDSASGEVLWEDYFTTIYGVAVSDNRVCVASGDVVVVGEEDNESPEPTFSFVAGSGDREYRFNASESTDPDGEIMAYEWDFTSDGTYEASGEVVTHTFESTGEYTVTLRVTDDQNGTATAQQTLTVE